MEWSRLARMLGAAHAECPSCGEAADAHPDGSFEERGTLEGSDREVLRCRHCGAGMTVRHARLTGRRRLELIDPAAWGRMEDDWYRQHPISEVSVPEAERLEPRELAGRLREAGVEGEPLLFLVAEAAWISEDEARRLIDLDG